MTKYTLEEVQKHDNIDSCWLIVGYRVYDVTPFLSDHPIDSKVIVKKGGKDVTRDFLFHSKKAQNIWKQYYIGKLDNYK